MPVTKKQELNRRLAAFQAKGKHSFADHYSAPEQIARLAHNTTVIERRSLTRGQRAIKGRTLDKDA